MILIANNHLHTNLIAFSTEHCYWCKSNFRHGYQYNYINYQSMCITHQKKYMAISKKSTVYKIVIHIPFTPNCP